MGARHAVPDGRHPGATAACGGVLPVDSLSVIVTSGCNLACTYCYRRGRSRLSLPWPELQRALDWALAAPGGALEVIFSGGEPLLGYPVLERAVRHLRARSRSAAPVKLRVLTNGILLDDRRLAFLAEQDVFVNLSCDGVAAAQVHRGAGTWRQLDALLDTMAARHPRWFASRCQVTATVTPANLPHLAGSVAYLCGKGVGTIALSPVMTVVPGCDDDLRPLLARQLRQVSDLSRRLHEATGRVPLVSLRRYAGGGPTPGKDRRPCVALEAGNPVLDVDGRISSCLMFAPSGLAGGDPRLKEIAADLDLGRIGEPGFEDRRRSFAAAVRNRGIFTSAPDLASRYGRCADCPAAATCRICPLTLLSAGRGRAPRTVPALLCAYNLLSAELRAAFPVQPDPRPPRVTAAALRQRMAHWAARGTGSLNPPAATAAAARPSAPSAAADPAPRPGGAGTARPGRSGRGPRPAARRRAGRRRPQRRGRPASR